MNEPTALISVNEAARLLQLSRTKLYEELTSGRLRSLRSGKRRLIPRTAIDSWIDERVAESEPS